MAFTTNQIETLNKNFFIKSKLFNTINFIKKNIKLTIFCLIIILSLGLSFLLITGVSSNTAIDNKSNKVMLKSLSEINKQLDEIVITIKNKETKGQLATIKDSIDSTKSLLSDNAKSSELKNIEDKIELIKSDIVDKISQTEKSILENSGTKQYLDTNSLPFKLVSIDIVGSQPYVSVDYENHITPLGVTDSLAGWKLVQADFDSSMAEFINEKNQFIRINL